MLLSVALGSLKARKTSVLLTILSVCISIVLLISVEHLRVQAKQSFKRTVSGVDLIVGARTGQLNLLMYSVFRVGSPSNNISWESIEAIGSMPMVDWVVPLSMGDAHRGFRVVGTTQHYFEHFQYGNKQSLVFNAGHPFDDAHGAVIGNDVADKLGYQLGDKLTISHGIGEISFVNHDDAPFEVIGILKQTGTPVDKTVHVSLSGIDLMHDKVPDHGDDEHDHDHQHEHQSEHAHEPEQVTAALLGLSSKIASLQVQRQINQFQGEPIMAILPGVALTELWQIVGSVENMLRLISLLILFSALLGLATMLLASMRERHREIAVLRAIGAGPFTIFLLIEVEALMITAIASLLALGGVWLAIDLFSPLLSAQYGIFIDNAIFTQSTWRAMLLVFLATFVVALLPAIKAYQRALHSGLQAQ
ncbi:MAG: ABC transporter permease [Aestuariibacter sp.]